MEELPVLYTIPEDQCVDECDTRILGMLSAYAKESSHVTKTSAKQRIELFNKYNLGRLNKHYFVLDYIEALRDCKTSVGVEAHSIVDVEQVEECPTELSSIVFSFESWGFDSIPINKDSDLIEKCHKNNQESNEPWLYRKLARIL